MTIRRTRGGSEAWSPDAPGSAALTQGGTHKLPVTSHVKRHSRRRSLIMAVGCTVALGVSNCMTDTCACSPPIVPALVIGRVLDHTGSPAPGARVHGYSGPAMGCHALDGDGELNSVDAAEDGSFRLALASGMQVDSVCVLVFARPPSNTAGLGNSDTALLVMDFRDELTVDTAEVELVLRAR